MDICAAALELVGAILIGNKDRRGFLVFLGGNALWFAVGWRAGLWGLVGIGCAFAVVNIRNFRVWGPNDQP